MEGRDNIFRNMDWILVLLYIVLVLMGWFNIYAANFDLDHPSIFDSGKEYGKQFIWICVAFTLGLVILAIDSQFFKDFAFIFYIIFTLLLVAVLIFGKEVNGAKSWFGVGSFGIQPSEFSKIGVSLALAFYLSDIKIKFNKLRILGVSLGIILIPAFLILMQPDAGTLLVYLAFILVLYREGVTGNIVLFGISLLVLIIATMSLIVYETYIFNEAWKISGLSILTIAILMIASMAFLIIRNYVLPRARKKTIKSLIFATIASMACVWMINTVYQSDKILKAHHKDRINILFGHTEDPSGAGYNVNQALTAIGSGGFSGKGYLDGVLTKFKYVPMQSTDFIFCTVGEEWGFIGSSVVIILLITLVLRIIMIAERQRSSFNRIFGYSVACILFMHIGINIGMAIGLVPVIGIPLPFFSYGGSSLFSFSFLVFILIKLDSDRLTKLS
ncbi:MAG: rod shape determining protein RodA [Patiriisocius sp.]|jgi:rod shape determining protein RodA